MPPSSVWASLLLLEAVQFNFSRAHVSRLHGSRTQLLSYERTQLHYATPGRRLGDEQWMPLRIHVHTEQLETDVSDPALLRYIKDDLLPAATRYLADVLKVRPVQGPLQIEQQCGAWFQNGVCKEVSQDFQSCGDATIPRLHFRDREVCNSYFGTRCTVSQGGEGITEADFALYVRASSAGSCSGTTAAYASPCRQDTNDRPIAGFITLCTMQKSLPDDVNLILHEMLHVLGFSSAMFPFFRDDSGAPRTARVGTWGQPPFDSEKRQFVADSNTVMTSTEADGTQKHYIALPRAVAAARQHFSCENLSKLPLEEFGGDGSAYSHWDERAMFTDLMGARMTTSPQLSEITLALMEDSGWYKPVYANAGQLRFGRYKGCAFLSDKCVARGLTKFPDSFCVNTNPSTCSSGQHRGSIGCTHDLMGKAICNGCIHSQPLPAKFQYFDNPSLGGSGSFIAFCPIWVPYTISTSGSDSFCATAPESGNSEATLGESFGSASRCILSTVVSTRFSRRPVESGGSCRQTKCQETGVQIRVGSNWVFCGMSDEGKQLTVGDGWLGHVVCPSFETVCGDRPGQSEKACFHPSVWRDGRCVCTPGYLNEDCTVEDTSVNRKRYPYALRYASHEFALKAGEVLPQVLQESPSILGNTTNLQFSISPPLPQGLIISATSGALGGLAAAPAKRIAYTIRARGGLGAVTTTLFLSVSCESAVTGCGRQETSSPTTSESSSSSGPISSTLRDPTTAGTPTSTSSTAAFAVTTTQRESTHQSSTTAPAVTTTERGTMSSIPGSVTESPPEGSSHQANTINKKSLQEQSWFMISAIAIATVLLLITISAVVCVCRRKCSKASLPHTADNVAFPAQSSGAIRAPNVRRSRSFNEDKNDKVAQMLEMGFEFEAALQALEHNAWDLTRAVTSLS